MLSYFIYFLRNNQYVVSFSIIIYCVGCTGNNHNKINIGNVLLSHNIDRSRRQYWHSKTVTIINLCGCEYRINRFY